MKRKISFVLSFMLALALSLSPTAHAMQNQNLSVKLKDATIDLPYEESQVIVERMENDNQVEITIRDKTTSEIIVVLGEIVEYIQEENSTLRASGITTHNTVYKDYPHGAAVARLWAKLELYTNGSFRQINGVVDHGWKENSDGPWHLTRESSSVVSLSGKYPSTSVNIQGSSTITGTATVSSGSGWSISILKSLDYEITNQTSYDWTFRKIIDHGFRYSI